MARTFVQPGEKITVTLGGTVSAGDPGVIGTGLIGIAQNDGVSGEQIEYAVSGVHKLPKVSGAVITQGQQVLWDVSEGAVDDDQAAPATGDFLCGYAWESAGSGVTEIAVLINARAPEVESGD